LQATQVAAKKAVAPAQAMTPSRGGRAKTMVAKTPEREIVKVPTRTLPPTDKLKAADPRLKWNPKTLQWTQPPPVQTRTANVTPSDASTRSPAARTLTQKSPVGAERSPAPRTLTQMSSVAADHANISRKPSLPSVRATPSDDDATQRAKRLEHCLRTGQWEKAISLAESAIVQRDGSASKQPRGVGCASRPALARADSSAARLPPMLALPDSSLTLIGSHAMVAPSDTIISSSTVNQSALRRAQLKAQPRRPLPSSPPPSLPNMAGAMSPATPPRSEPRIRQDSQRLDTRMSSARPAPPPYLANRALSSPLSEREADTSSMARQASARRAQARIRRAGSENETVM